MEPAADGARRRGALLSKPFLGPSLLFLFLILLCGCGGGGGGASSYTPPAFAVSGSYPLNGNLSVAVDSKVIVTFTRSIGSVIEIRDNMTLAVKTSGAVIDGTYTLSDSGEVATFVPEENLSELTWYVLRIGREIRSGTSDTMAADYVSSFRTAEGNGTEPPPPPPVTTRILRELEEMQVGRSSHVSVLLPDGDVLLAGGFATAYTVTGTTEIFDTDIEEFTRASGNMVEGRGYAAGLLLGNGTVLITGGVVGASAVETNTTEIYNPLNRIFGAAGQMIDARAFHTMTLLDDGRVLIAGGTVPTSTGTYSSRKSEIYNPSTGAFTALPDMAVYRAGHTATKLDDGRVLLTGGNGTDTTAEIFDPATDTFTSVGGAMQSPRRGHVAAHLGDGVVALNGGGQRTGEYYIPAQDLFRPANAYPLYDRTDHTMNWTQSGKLLLVGGSYWSGNVIFFGSTMEYFDPRTGTFQPSQLPLPIPVTRHRATNLADGRILITGGSNLASNQPELSQALIYEEIVD
jgi:Bacterial Ig-like domain/Kelch motif